MDKFTLQALEKYDVVMFDARETSDNVVVVAKDDVKNRTAEKIDLPLLKDMMDICRAKEAKMVIRVHDTSKEILKEIGSYVKQHDLHSRVVITSSNPVVPFMLKRKDSQFLSGLSYERFGMSEHFKKYHKGKLLYRYLGEFLDTVMFYGMIFLSLHTNNLPAMHSFVLPEFIGADLLFVDKKDIDLRFIELAKKRKMKIIAVNADKKEDQQWLKKVAMAQTLTIWSARKRSFS
ncbi:unnamed protein product [Nippostrongylus brasiliensis]|uniref:Glycerophosphodiester phosphodiesterase 1 (inferred by orthology to a human protein) n=1 Tax=Nippostrongylus brasiliensis TaxID=27835 RepID=A0A0N4YEA4_NIPBR|nr:unnamed protein product [Nippostrongylus brasiliensis]